MPIVTEIDEMPPAALLEIEAEKFALYAAMHELLNPEITDLLGLYVLSELTIKLYENGVYLGIHDPTISSHPRLFFAAGVFQTVLVSADEKTVWSSTEGVDDLRPVRGLYVPGGMAVGLQGIQNNRCTYVVLGLRGDEPRAGMAFDHPLIANRWERQGTERVRSVISGSRLP
jgi:hypothetical protein